MARTRKGTPTAQQFCTFRCPHSGFPPADAAGLCRTMAAVHCRKLGKLVDKNAPCRWPEASAGRRPRQVRAGAKSKT
jgi:hypothetical protein